MMLPEQTLAALIADRRLQSPVDLARAVEAEVLAALMSQNATSKAVRGKPCTPGDA